MVFTPAQREAAQQGTDVNFAVGRATSKYYLWPSGIVPFSIEKQLSKYYIKWIHKMLLHTTNRSMMNRKAIWLVHISSLFCSWYGLLPMDRSLWSYFRRNGSDFLRSCKNVTACTPASSRSLLEAIMWIPITLSNIAVFQKTIKINHYIVVQIIINLNIKIGLSNLSEDDPLTSEAINDGMKQWSSNTCITFKERTTETAFIYFFIGGRHVTSINFHSAHNTHVD